MNPSKEHGVSLVELLLVFVVVISVALLVINSGPTILSVGQSRRTSLAREIASRQIEKMRKIPFDSLLLETNSFTDSALSSLPASSATYTVDDCPVSLCDEDEVMKRIRVEVSWEDSGETKTVELWTLTAAGGIGE